jgi:hypothetical protein
VSARRAAAVLMLAVLGGCADSTPPAAPAPPADVAKPADPSRNGARAGQWARAESERDKLPIAWQYREDFAVAPPRQLPQLVVVSQALKIPYVGQTDPALQQGFAVLEQHLLDVLDDKAELVAVLDWNQQHDWFFYADAGVTRESVEAALGDVGGRDIRVTLENDAQQQFYGTLKQRVSGTP